MVRSRRKLAFFFIVLFLVSLQGTGWSGQNINVARAETLINDDGLSGVAYLTKSPVIYESLPAASPNPAKVYFSDFGQFVANPLLRFWRLNGKFDTFGGPISRAEIISNGNGGEQKAVTVQYFEKKALAYYPELVGTGWEIRPYEIGRKFLERLAGPNQNDFPFAKVPPVSNTPTRRYFPETGHTLSAGFYNLYNRSGALLMWGYPLSEEYSATLPDGKLYTLQLFERGRMAWRPDIGPIVDPYFGGQMAISLGANRAVELNEAAGQAVAPVYSSWAWEHWVDINLSMQKETFYEGDVAVRTNLVTTGKPGYSTPTGNFSIIRRVYNEHMVGGSIGTSEYYDLYDVLYTQYFTWQGHALHYAWWRSVFGVTGSHGCVNQDYYSSLFAWNWLTLGSRVTIHY